MTRLFIGAFALVCLTGCFTQLRQTREPVSADCAAWPAPVDEGSTLTLGIGEIGRFENVTILFTELELDRGRAYPYPGYWRYPGWRPLYSPLFYGPRWYGPPPRRVLHDLVVLSVCRPGEVPVDRKLYLTPDPWYAQDETTVGSYRIAVDRLERVRSKDPDGVDKWRLTLKVERVGGPEGS
jgi:hypothetical protein